MSTQENKEPKWVEQRRSICETCRFNTKNKEDDDAREFDVCVLDNKGISERVAEENQMCPNNKWQKQKVNITYGKFRDFFIIPEDIKAKVYVDEHIELDYEDKEVGEYFSDSFIIGNVYSMYVMKVTCIKSNITYNLTKQENNSFRIDYNMFDIPKGENITSLYIKVIIRSRLSIHNKEVIIPIKIKFNKKDEL